MAIFKTLTEKQKRLEQFFKSQKYDDKDRQTIIKAKEDKIKNAHQTLKMQSKHKADSLAKKLL